MHYSSWWFSLANAKQNQADPGRPVKTQPCEVRVGPRAQKNKDIQFLNDFLQPSCLVVVRASYMWEKNRMNQ